MICYEKKYERSSKVLGRFEREIVFIGVKCGGIVGSKGEERCSRVGV